MNTFETNGSVETTLSPDEEKNLCITVELLKQLKRPDPLLPVDVIVVKDLDTLYEVHRKENRFKLLLRQPHSGKAQDIYPVLSFAWATTLTWNETVNKNTQFTPTWGMRMAECWRIIRGEYTGLTADEFFNKFK